MSVLIEAWNQATTFHGMSLSDHHTVLAEVNIPDPDAKDLPGKLQSFFDDVIGWLKTICYAVAMISGLILLIFMALGFRGRSNFAKDALTHYPWVFVATIGPGALWGILDSVSS